MTTAMNGRRILVTGASGFIGVHLCCRLRMAGAEVHGISRNPPTGDGDHWWQCDLASAAETIEVVRRVRPDVIYHLASAVTGARELAAVLDTFHANLHSTVNLLAGAAETGVRRFILTGSMEEGDAGQAEQAPCSPYAAAKIGARAYARLFHALYGLGVVHLRLAMVYGPGQNDARKLVPYVIRELLAGRTPTIGSGDRRVDWIYVRDVVDALLAAGGRDGIDGESIDVGSGTLASVRTVVEHLVTASGQAITPHFGARADRPLEFEYVADVARTEQLLGWRAAIDLKEGLRRTYQWYEHETAGRRPGLAAA